MLSSISPSLRGAKGEAIQGVVRGPGLLRVARNDGAGMLPHHVQLFAQAASALTALTAILLSVSSVFFSSESVASRSLTASLLPSLVAQAFSVP
jgi:hypothetical protein